jgi:hypothetical protein
MKKQIIQIDRDQLYKEVWNTPIQRLAKEKYDVSDRGLAKVCKKLNIPTPSRGYWARVQNGQNVPPRPLPEIRRGGITEYLLHGRYPKKQKHEVIPDVEPDALELIRDLQNPNCRFVVPSDLRTSHPLIKKAKEDLFRDRTKNDVRMFPKEATCLAMFTGVHSVKRGLRIMAALLNYFECMGFPFYTERNPLHVNVVEIFGEKVRFTLREKIITCERPWGEWGQHGKSKLTPRFTYEQTGQLTLRINTYRTDGHRKSWSDGKLKKIEDKLNDAMIAFITFADTERKERIAQEDSARLWAEQEKAWDELTRKREIEAKCINRFERQAQNWEKSKQLREYIQQVELIARNKPLAADLQADFDKWLQMVKSYVDQIDPFNGPFSSLISTTEDHNE